MQPRVTRDTHSNLSTVLAEIQSNHSRPLPCWVCKKSLQFSSRLAAAEPVPYIQHSVHAKSRSSCIFDPRHPLLNHSLLPISTNTSLNPLLLCCLLVPCLPLTSQDKFSPLYLYKLSIPFLCVHKSVCVCMHALCFQKACRRIPSGFGCGFLWSVVFVWEVLRLHWESGLIEAAVRITVRGYMFYFVGEALTTL